MQLPGCDDNDPPEATLVCGQLFSEFSPAELITSVCACNSHRYQEDLQTENTKWNYSLLAGFSKTYIYKIKFKKIMHLPASNTLFNFIQKRIKKYILYTLGLNII